MQNYASAINDFNRARWKGTMELLLARLTGRSADLLSYEEVRKAVQGVNQADRGLQNVPLNAIVGSLGRYKDFTQSFMPIQDSDAHRWAGVRVAAERGQGLPPIELYQIGEAYFVKDGNHRVSIARDLDLPTIQAWVTEIQTRVPFAPGMNADDLILARQQTEFLAETKLDELRPESNVRVTEPGKYPILIDHIRTHQYYMGIDQDREIGWEEAVIHWYDEIYLNVIQLIRQRGILDAFPDRTETDFYVWLADHRQDLEREIGWDLTTEAAVDSLVETTSLSTITNRVLDLAGVTKPAVAPATPILETVAAEIKPNERRQLVREMLVILGPEIDNQTMLGQAVEVAKHEGATLRAIYTSADTNGQRDAVPKTIQELFDWVIAEAGVVGRLAADVDDWHVSALERARFNDFILAPIYSTGKTKVFDAQWRSRWRNLLVQSARPVLAVTDKTFVPEKGLLVYSGDKKDYQALFVSAWLASQWGTELTVGIGGEPTQRNTLIREVESYLDQYGVTARFEAKYVDSPAEILQVVGQDDYRLIIASMRRSLWSRFTASTKLHILDLLQDTP
ncbi:MAG: hypothetical protein AAGD96_20160, partial [Chloroflexota bacterium]